ncbi:MAG TPA: HAD-IIB family hydrolase [Candidatus Nanoarchaeia archaeon]|nr:HAD-IIB family hydrolase [Candidatus Nanoarchaeia archaeon]
MVKKIDTAIIVAGGLGTRLRPLTDHAPKPLLPVRGKPIIEHVIKNLKKHGINNIVISIGYKAKQVQDYFGGGHSLGVSISYVIENEPLGTGGAVRLASRDLDKPFFLVWGDNLMDVNFSRMEEQFLESNASIIMALTPREDVENFGVAKLEQNKIIAFVEKPKREEAPSKLINAGAFILDPVCLELLPDGRSSLEKDCFEKLAPEERIVGYIHEGQWFPTDTLEKYHHANAFFQPELNFKEKTVIIADVDGTICDSCQVISSAMAEQISKMISQGYQFAFISGTKTGDLQEMISSLLSQPHHLLATMGTNYSIIGENSVNNIYNHSFTIEEKEEIMAAMRKLISHFEIASLTTPEDQLQDRDSQITLSAIGRHAPSDKKAAYDQDCSKRQRWMEFLKIHLDDSKYGIKIGGTTSIDVTRKGLDKEWGIKQFADYHKIPLSSILFFGDKIHPGGNDFPAATIVDCISVKSPAETLWQLRLIELLSNITITERPWGKFEQFTANQPSTVKILEVKPQQRLSLQSHQHREELWTALDDGVIAEVNGVKKCLKAGEKIVIPKGARHRLSSEQAEVRVLEIAFGNFDENDITRYEDDFGRI